jgi:hypothetical protein
MKNKSNETQSKRASAEGEKPLQMQGGYEK